MLLICALELNSFDGGNVLSSVIKTSIFFASAMNPPLSESIESPVPRRLQRYDKKGDKIFKLLLIV
jgi:hypothetical protein